MATKLNAYLNFKDQSRPAMEFYKTVFGGKLELHTFKELGAAHSPDEEDLIMHSVLTSGDIEFMAADTPNDMEYKPAAGFGMSLSGDNEAELKGYFDKLCEGGTVTVPMAKQVWGDQFGMCTDKFGVSWLVNIAAPKA